MAWRGPRPNPLLRLLVPQTAPGGSILPRRPGDQATIGRDCVAVGLDHDAGYRDAGRWSEVNAYLRCTLSAGLIDEQDFLSLSWRLRGSGFARVR